MTTQVRLKLIPKALVVCMATTISAPVFAMQTLDDSALSSINAADGISIQNKADKVEIASVKWTDNNAANVKTLDLQNITTTKSAPDASSVRALGVNSSLAVNVGSDATGSSPTYKPSLNVNLISDQSFTTIEKVMMGTSTNSLGELAIENPNTNQLQLTTIGGLFNQSGTASLGILLDSMNLYITKKDSTGAYNQLILADVRANMTASGQLYIDAKQGIVFEGSLGGACGDSVSGTTVTHSCSGYTTTNTDAAAGLQVSLMHRGDVGGSSPSTHTYSTTDAKSGGLISFGLSGRTINDKISIRGTNAMTTAQANALGGMVNGSGSNAIVGDRGIAISFKGETTDNTSWQIGEAGSNGHGLRFSGFRDFNDINNSAKHGLFDFGNLYLNLANTTYMALPDALIANSNNKLLATTGVATTVLASGANGDYAQSGLPANDALIAMTRGMSLQVVPQQTVFYSNTGASSAKTFGSWSFLSTFYNVNSNIALSANATDPNKLDVAFAMSTQGSDNLTGTTSKTTTIGLVNTGGCDDAATGAPRNNTSSGCNQFIGWRNIDLLSKGKGSLDLKKDRIRMNLDNLLLALDTDVAVSYLPGAITASGQTMVWDAATLKKDKLFGLRLKFDVASGYVDLVPGYDTGTVGRGAGYENRPLGLEAELLLTGSVSGAASRPTMIQIVDGPTNTTVGLEQISGRLQVKNAYIDTQSNAMEFGSTLVFNPNNVVAEDFRIREINLYPNGDGTKKQTFGELAIAGGQIYSRMKLTPR